MGDTLDLRLAGADTFEPLVGSEFRSLDGASVLVLTEVFRYSVQPHAPRPEPFSLLFSGEPGLAQGTYELENDALGRVDLFLVPIGPGSDGRPRYEAAFN